MQWRSKRKLTYTTLALLPLVIVAGVIYAATFFPEPTCFDGEQNGTEAGVDCGGACQAVCQAQTPAVDIVWDRAFRVSGDVYSVAAYIENPNTNLIARDVPYIFRLYDEDNIFITERRGEINLLPQPTTLAFVGGIDTNGRLPARVVFSLAEDPFWQQADFSDVRFTVSDRALTLSPRPRLSLNITNTNTGVFDQIRLAAIIFNQAGEAVHVSRTVLGRLGVGESTPVIFTWRELFVEADSYRSEIIPVNYAPAE